jgi:hypothetical protein
LLQEVATDEVRELERGSGAAADTPLFASRTQHVIFCFHEKIAAPKMARGAGSIRCAGLPRILGRGQARSVSAESFTDRENQSIKLTDRPHQGKGWKALQFLALRQAWVAPEL